MDYTGYLDEYGMVTVNGVPDYPGAHSENGLLFTVVAMQSMGLNGQYFNTNFEKLFNACFIDGILYRSPEPYPKPDSHDNYEAVILGSLLENTPNPPRKLLWSLIKHFGVIRGEIFLRFPQLILLWPAAFKWTKYPLFPFIYIIYLFQNPNILDPGGTHLQFNLVSSIDILYPKCNFLKKWFTNLKNYGTMYNIMSKYYGPNHPTTLIWKDSKVC